MRIALLSSGTGWHVDDLLRAASAAGHLAQPVDFRLTHTGVNSPPRPLVGFDAAIVRTMPEGSLEQIIFRMDLLHAAQDAGVRVLNPSRALETCVDKFLTSSRLVNAGIPTPPTHVGQKADTALEAFAQLGGDVVVKPIFGSEGRGMVRLTEAETAWRTFRTLQRTGQVIYQQKFIRHPGWDLRAFVIGGRVIAAMRRISKDDWRTNIAVGGSASQVTLTPSETDLAISAAKAVGCPVAGVDLLPGPGGEMYVIEVNAVPGWRMLAPVSGIDIAAEVIAYLGKRDE